MAEPSATARPLLISVGAMPASLKSASRESDRGAPKKSASTGIARGWWDFRPEPDRRRMAVGETAWRRLWRLRPLRWLVGSHCLLFARWAWAGSVQTRSQKAVDRSCSLGRDIAIFQRKVRSDRRKRIPQDDDLAEERRDLSGGRHKRILEVEAIQPVEWPGVRRSIMNRKDQSFAWRFGAVSSTDGWFHPERLETGADSRPMRRTRLWSRR